jgi:polysaccharide pyruvyl transferase WcaK-like protein
LRVAFYSGVETHIAEEASSTLQQFARRHRAALVPIPIAFHESANDHLTIRRLLRGFDDGSDGGLSLDTPLMLIKQVSRCRIVVTGAYHAAVFALGQGIPVVCMTNSDYYLAKFQGLVDLFGVGCTIVSLSEPDLSGRLTTAMENAWGSADVVRPSLLRSALLQIRESQAAYHRIQSMIASTDNQDQLALSR